MTATTRCIGPWPTCGHPRNTCTASPAYQAALSVKTANGMTQPHQIDREAVAALIERLRENLSDSAPSRLVCVESADVQSALDTIEALSRPMLAVAWRDELRSIIFTATHAVLPLVDDVTGLGIRERAAMQVEIADRILQALAVIPTEGLGSSLRDTHRVAETAVVVPKEPTEAMIEAGLEWSGDCNGGEREMMGLAYAAMIAAAPASDTTGGENQ